MSRRMMWVIILIVCGVAAAIALGVLGTRHEPSTSKTQAVNNLCASLQALDGSVKNLTSLPSSASKSEYQADVTAVQNDWNTVKTDAQAVQNAPMGDLDSAWNNFTAAVKNVPNSSSVSDAVSSITASAQALVSAAETTASEVNCTSSSSSPTTTTTTTG